MFSTSVLTFLPAVDCLTTHFQGQSYSYVTTEGQSASLPWNKAAIWDLRPDLYYCQTVGCLWMWRALSDEMTGLSFIIAVGPRQRSYSWVRVPWDSRPYFTLSDYKLPFLSPPTTRKVTMEVFDSASTRETAVPAVLLHLGTERRENTVRLFLFAIVAVQTCLFCEAVTQYRLLNSCFFRGLCLPTVLHAKIPYLLSSDKTKLETQE
jgi:hypothetical protein